MDPVSRRLAAAAMGLAFGLSRDEELAKTRLDLERVRMEREDFRQGNGSETSFMQDDDYFCKHFKVLDTARSTLKRLHETSNDFAIAVEALSRIAKCGKGGEALIAVQALDEMGMSSETSDEPDASERE